MLRILGLFYFTDITEVFMAKKAMIIAAFLFAMGFGPVFGQERGVVDITLDVKMNVSEISKVAFSDEGERTPAEAVKSYTYANFGPLDGNWFTKDSVLRFSYTTDTFGGSMVLKPQDFGVPPWKVWLMLGPMFRITAGNDIESIYADPQGADPGLRVYTGGAGGNGWDGSLNPDNITQDKGLLLEGIFGPVTAAVTGLVFNPTNKPALVTDGSEVYASESRNLQVGARVGSEIGTWGKINASYYVQYNKQGSGYRVIDRELFPTGARSETYVHYFGAYASLSPLENLGVTLGYGGVINKYLDQFRSMTSTTELVTVQPLVIQQAAMLNARYTDIIPGLTIRTDHNFTFWTDKNLSALASNVSGWVDRGLEATASYSDSPDVAHFLLWNGLGGGYHLTDRIGLELYVRNLYRRDLALDVDGSEYKLERDELSVEPKLVLYITPWVTMSFAVTVINTVTTASEDLNLKGRNLFRRTGGSTSNYRRQETKDTVLVVQVPIGFTMQF